VIRGGVTDPGLSGDMSQGQRVRSSFLGKGTSCLEEGVAKIAVMVLRALG
jgi:hypothetical protein